MTDIEKVNRRFKAHYYCHGKMEQCFDPPEFLLSNGIYPTKIRPEELPPWYIEFTYWNTRYVDTSRVTNLIYRPCRLPHHNHLFKDDMLFLTYDGVEPKWDNDYIGLFLTSPHETLWGWSLVYGLISAREYSGIDISEQLEVLKAKILRYNEEYNEPWPDPNIPYDPEEIIADVEKHVKEKREAYENLHPGIYRL